MTSKYFIINGDCLQEMAKMEPNSIDFIVTDPPYGLYFMGKKWDGETPSLEYWQSALRVAKPGAMLAAFGGSRTHHRLMCAIEDAGWEIRDVIMWLYGSGFPKSHNKFGLEGYGTALKPAYEPIIIAMKPLDGTYAQNAEKWGIAGINIDESRIECLTGGRWPSNLILDEEAGKILDEQSGILKSGKVKPTEAAPFGGIYEHGRTKRNTNHFNASSGGASRFFYCAKASSKERGQANNHPTVKPIALMKYIIKLLAPPGNPILLDPFAGSGSTLLAAKELGISAIGIEKETEYSEIAQKRLDNVEAPEDNPQMDMFG